MQELPSFRFSCGIHAMIVAFFLRAGAFLEEEIENGGWEEHCEEEIGNNDWGSGE